MWARAARDLVVECAADDFHPVSYGPLRADGSPVDTLLTEQPELGCQAFVDCALAPYDMLGGFLWRSGSDQAALPAQMCS